MLSSIIIGGGPGGLGPLIWAAQHGLLPDWLDRGVAVVERQTHLGGTLGRFGIHSDSLGGSYLECIEAPGLPEALLPLRDDPLALEMAQYRNTFPPLSLVDRCSAPASMPGRCRFGA
jgi:phytoene dehydrogenase-like protein